MNITLGVPRIKEIINATKSIKTPVIKAPLISSKEEKAARIVKARVERTTLGQVSSSIDEVYTSMSACIRIRLDVDTISRLQLPITEHTVKAALVAHRKLKLKDEDITTSTDRGVPQIQITAPKRGKKESDQLPPMFALQAIKSQLEAVVVCGLVTANRAVVNYNKDNKYELLVEGNGLRGVMGTAGVHGELASSNHVLEVETVLGVEAARITIIKEIQDTMEGHGLFIDPRHVYLLADTMSYRGKILGITRHGVAQMKQSVLMLASFEKTADHLFEAAMRNTVDSISGVSECIIMGQPIRIGTGLFSLLAKLD